LSFSSAVAFTFLEDGDRVTAFGFYSGTYKATGKSMRTAFAHLYALNALRDGKILRMTQYVDTVMVQRALDLTSQTAGSPRFPASRSSSGR
jgi:hypothetical protein